MILLLVLLAWLEPMSPGTHSPHIPPANAALTKAPLCTVAKARSANGLLVVKIKEACR
jgi:hypothetical protein